MLEINSKLGLETTPSIQAKGPVLWAKWTDSGLISGSGFRMGRGPGCCYCLSLFLLSPPAIPISSLAATTGRHRHCRWHSLLQLFFSIAQLLLRVASHPSPTKLRRPPATSVVTVAVANASSLPRARVVWDGLGLRGWGRNEEKERAEKKEMGSGKAEEHEHPPC